MPKWKEMTLVIKCVLSDMMQINEQRCYPKPDIDNLNKIEIAQTDIIKWLSTLYIYCPNFRI